MGLHVHVRKWFRTRGKSMMKRIRCLLKNFDSTISRKNRLSLEVRRKPREIGNYSAWQVAHYRHFWRIWNNTYSTKVGLKCTSQVSKATCDSSISRFSQLSVQSFSSRDRSSHSLSIRLASGFSTWLVPLPLAVILKAELVLPTCILRSIVWKY